MEEEMTTCSRGGCVGECTSPWNSVLQPRRCGWSGKLWPVKKQHVAVARIQNKHP
jgi:hypothetical protein